MAEDVFGLVGTVQAGTFHVEAAVAEGGFGVVYRARHTAFRAPVALKCLKVPRAFSADERRAFEEQFRAEGELLFQLSASTPTVVRPLQVGMLSSPRFEFIPFMALEWLEGQSLDQMIRERAGRGEPPLSVADAVQLLRPVAYALDNAHRFPGPNGVVCILHRDMKPDNVFIADLRGQKAVRILDFGIAKVKSAATAIVGKASAQADLLSAFTPAYGAPEQWVPKRYGQTGPWTDVYGFALTVIETVCGRPPMEGDQAAMMGSALDEKLRPTPRACGVVVSDAVEAVFTKAVAVDPKDRYPSLAEFWRDLESAVEGRAPQALLSSRPADPNAATRIRVGQAPATTAIPDLMPAPGPPVSAPVAAPSAPHASGPRSFDEFDDLELDHVSLPMAPPSPPQSAPKRGMQLDMDPIPPPPRVTPVRRPAPSETRAHAERAAVRSVKDRLFLPVTLMFLGTVVAAVASVYQVVTGTTLAWGPVRPLLVAGPLVLIGVLVGAIRLFAVGEE
jgi:eukaryotic-like serine/threonine-protein kinase